MKPKIGILTIFNDADSAYSLVNVVRTQAEMLIYGGYNPALFVTSKFPGDRKGIWSGTRVEIRRTCEEERSSEEIVKVLRPLIEDIDIMLCHDVVFLSQYSQWGDAVRILAKESPMVWLHWQHSRGDSQVYPCDNSWYCYPNKGDSDHVAWLNQTSLDRIRYVPHPLDYEYLGWPELAIRIADDTGHPFVDVAAILPTRLDRQKQVEKAIRLIAGCKKAGRSVSFILADAYATGDRFIDYAKYLRSVAIEQNVSSEVTFLGESYDECRAYTPRNVIKALYEMSNVFIQPSNSETSSLVAKEAALAGNLLVLNSDFSPILHLYEKALAFPFSSVIHPDTKYFRHITLADGSTVKVEDAQLYWDDESKNTLLPTLDSQIIQTVKRQQFKDGAPGIVFKDYLEPLLREAYDTMHVGSNPLEMSTGKNVDQDVTAIITTLDNLSLLQRQLEILIRECGHIIVVNNGSIDGTREWLEDNQYPRVSFINRENFGAGPGRNAGLTLWNGSTPYTLMVDGGILPPIGAVKQLKSYLERHPEAAVISPEVATCFTPEESEATLIAPVLSDDLECFWQRCLSSTAFCLARKEAWVTRFSEEGPYGEPGWGVDDNDMAYRWDDLDIVHHEFTLRATGWKLYRRASGSFSRIEKETGIGANQYGSVYERRNVKCQQDWRKYHAALYGRAGVPSVSYVIRDVPMPEFAKLVKRLHDDDPNCEIIAEGYESGECNDDDYDTDYPDVEWWLDTFALRWPWGDTTIDPDGKILHRGKDYPEELWSGDVVRNRGPLVDALIIDNVEVYLDLANATRE